MRKQFKNCPDCGAHLDPNESCECTKKAPSAATLRAGSAGTENINTQSIEQEAAPVKPYPGWIDLEGLQFRFKCAIDLVDTVHQSMVYGDQAAEAYADALWSVHGYLSSLNKELGSIAADMRVSA